MKTSKRKGRGIIVILRVVGIYSQIPNLPHQLQFGSFHGLE